MNVKSSSNALRRTPPGFTKSQSPQATRPPHERWYVGSDVYASTSEMLASGENLDGKNSIYKYAYFTRGEELPEAQKKRSGRKFAMVTGGVGAGLTTLIGGAMIVNYLDGYAPVSKPIMVIGGMLAGTALLAGGAYKLGYHELPDTGIYSQEGVIRQEDDSTKLYVRGELENEVDLAAYARAEVPEVKPNGRQDYGEQWWNRSYDPEY